MTPPLGWVASEPEGHTRNDPSRGARRDKHPIGPPLVGSDTAEEDTRLPESGPPGGTGKLVEASATQAKTEPRSDLDQG